MKFPEWLEIEMEAERIPVPTWRDAAAVVASLLALAALAALLIITAP